MTDLLELMGLNRMLTPEERRRLHANRPGLGLHADRPGTGPAGETCRTCAHLYRHRCAKTYLKCGHPVCRPKWTHGPGTDIRARDPACSKWQRKDD